MRRSFLLIFVSAIIAAAAIAFVGWIDQRTTSMQVSMPTEIAALPVVDAAAPPTQAATPAPTLNPEGMIVHTVARGESLVRIAGYYGVTVDAIVAANNLIDPDRILVGQTLLIPAVSGTTNAPTTSLTLNTTSPTMMLGVTVTQTRLSPTNIGVAVIVSNSTPTPLPPAPNAVNGITVSRLIVIPDNVRENIQQIYVAGQALGRDPHSFSKLGDSTIENPHFLARFDQPGTYNLGVYGYLQPVIDYYAGSFGRESLAVRRGLHSWAVMDPMWATNGICSGNESILACEIRVHNPSVIFIRLGSNDVGVPDSFDRNLREIVEYCIENGVVPILGTKADRHEGAGNVNNDIIRQVAEDYELPLWDFDLIAQTIPGRGLLGDGVHMTTYFAHDYSASLAFERGHAMHNLTALMALESVWQELE